MRNAGIEIILPECYIIKSKKYDIIAVMSRLYYETNNKTSGGQLASGSNINARSYLEKVAKLIPAEINIAYISMIGLVPSIQLEVSKFYFYWGIFVFCLILTPLYLNWQSEKDRPKKVHIVLSTIAFIFGHIHLQVRFFVH